MNHVWFFFKLLEVLIGSVCIYIHHMAALNKLEPLSHSLLFCGTFVSFVLLATIRCIRLMMGMRTLLRSLLFVSVCGTCMHYLCALVSMNYAENDFHLQFMSEQGETRHYYFRYCRLQSIASMAAGCVHLIEIVLLLDIIVKVPLTDQQKIELVTEPPIKDDTWETMSNDERDTLARTSAEIYLLGKDFDHWVRVKSKFFRRLAGYQPIIAPPEPQTPVSESISESRENAVEFI